MKFRIFLVLSVLVLAIWPFHKKKVLPAPIPHVEIQTEENDPEQDLLSSGYCVVQDKVFFFAGPDGLVITSTESCMDALQKWYRTPVRRSIRSQA